MVLFAEAGKDFVDFLFHCLALPVGTVISFLTNVGATGSLVSLYKSIENLNDIYLKPNQKEALCSNTSTSSCNYYVTDAPSAKCPYCGCSMSTKLSWFKGGYMKGVVTYMVMDDLVVKPMSTISCITLINKFNVWEIGDLEEKVTDFGMDECYNLRKVHLSATLEEKRIT
ncbi:hypothetical protein ACJRO7_003046 [Eucalyptus globulus]|uniref:Uncharacterized protein n=1 Tax=Eucalyptus globulus TaxID=34317 RepID=A0ABD3IUA1_EUCGL